MEMSIVKRPTGTPAQDESDVSHAGIPDANENDTQSELMNN
jgi:hypothetical protein